MKEEPSQEEEEYPCDEECDPLDIRLESGDGTRVVQSHMEERLNLQAEALEVLSKFLSFCNLAGNRPIFHITIPELSFPLLGWQ